MSAEDRRPWSGAAFDFHIFEFLPGVLDDSRGERLDVRVSEIGDVDLDGPDGNLDHLNLFGHVAP